MMVLRVSLRELEVFVAVADCESVTLAAAKVAMTQSAASQSLATLEGNLSVQLFDRINRRLILNEHGRLLLPRARAILDGTQDIQQLFDHHSAFFVQLGASTTIANYLLPKRIAQFYQQQPQARLELLVANTADIIDAVVAFKVDMGLIEGLCHHPDVRIEPWQQDTLVLFAAADHPLAQGRVSLQQLAQAQWILRESGSGTREEVERLLLPHLGRFGVVMELGHSEAIKRVVASGLGISCLSLHVIQELLDYGQVALIQAPLPALERTLYRIQHKNKSPTRGMMAFNQL